jgi:hypothetical protein
VTISCVILDVEGKVVSEGIAAVTQPQGEPPAGLEYGRALFAEAARTIYDAELVGEPVGDETFERLLADSLREHAVVIAVINDAEARTRT